ncbi:zinc ABC transporter substrate-binding protein ZnuA [Rhizobium sp. SSA_523]|uniref:zinc ABC transporter substrate-binding protein ZnuA n=1 Tax=Rhizobium sp. SSA_523 TaxID=2952477 RepID=UPI0020906300|nr:zinc ABC transporter substrate-binding protein ZnuA [Rhizobium sp. SSA_523]MCO5730184.1 zinc ABC transporter substrate-binding protein ZnuA [Rhizobium sp. SSA_523]WKC25925.1 zinc ABC transporter substrate-binding protein ZnuA [Rhizobium sp. SSA_523]
MRNASRLSLPAAAILGAALASATSTAAGAAPDVVVSIKPIHSLVAAVMQDVAEPQLIVEGAASPHTYSMRPSNARAIEGADLVFWVGPGLEAFLDKPLDALAGKADVVALSQAPGVERLPFREGGAFEAHQHDDHAHVHDHDHDHAHADDHGHDEEAHAGHSAQEHGKGEHGKEEHGHDHGGFDAHLWLDPENAAAMVKEIQAKLIAADPANAETYTRNTMALLKRLDGLDSEIARTIAPVKDEPFIVFHDAYQYFEHHYGVRVAGSVTVSPESAPGAERLKQIQAKIGELGATCVFAEPQFEPKLIKVVTEGTSARSGVLDPEGATLEAGPDLYFNLMNGLATSLVDCLGRDT